MQTHGLVLSEKKMVLFQEYVDFLGLHVYKGQIQMQPHVLSKIVEFPDELRDTKSIQRFSGVLNYIHKYLPRISEKTTPIRRHTSGGWSNQATKAVREIKPICKNLPKLKPPSQGKLILQTNASDEFWSAVLFEKGEELELEELCTYASGEFTPSQKNYFTAKKETLAIFNGIQRFELYLAPVKLLIRNDSMNFKHFMSAKLNRKMARGRLIAWQNWFQ